MPSANALVVLVALAASALGGPALFGQNTTMQGFEFMVNTLTEGGKLMGAAASDGEGNFVVVWSDTSADGSSLGVFARRFDRAGTPQSHDFQVNAYTTGAQFDPSIAMNGQGTFVIAWSSNLQDGSSNGVFGRRFDASGAAAGDEFQIATFSAGNQQSSAVAIDSTGAFAAVWSDNGGTGADFDIRGRRFDSAGVAQGLELSIDTDIDTNSDQSSPEVAMDAEGGFVVVWRDDFSTGRILARRFDSTGAPGSGSEVAGNEVANPDVEVDADGDFLVAWQSYGKDGHQEGVFARCFDATATALGVEFQVSAFTLLDQEHPRVGRNHEGSFVVAWSGRGEDGFVGNSAFVQSTLIDCENPVARVVGRGSDPVVTAGPGRDLVIAWSRGGEVLARRVGVGRAAQPQASSIDIDGNGEREPLKDGVLLLRFLFGFTGPALVDGAVADDCTRCEAEEIEAYLEEL